MRVLAGCLVVSLSACGGGDHEVECEQHSNCNLESGGLCVEYEATGRKWCQYPDETCASGMRWSDFDTGDGLSGVCVEEGTPDAGTPDAGTPDARTIDASEADAGPIDALAYDAIPPDAGSPTGPLAKSFGDTSNDNGYSVARDGDGNYIVAGSFHGTVNFGGDDLSSVSDSEDIFVAKFAPNGAHIWSRRFGAAGQDVANAVDIDASRNVFVTGEFRNTVNFGGEDLTAPGTTNAPDVFLIKLSGVDGGHLWSKRFGSTGTDRGSALVVDSGNNVIVAGKFTGTVNFGGSNYTETGGGGDIFYAKYAGGDGSHSWSKQLVGAGSDEGTGICVDGSNDVFLAGIYTSGIDPGDGTVTGRGNMVGKYSGSTGNHVWSNTIIGATAMKAAVASDGTDAILVGSFRDTIVLGGENLSPLDSWDDAFAVRFDGATGAHEWHWHGTGTSHEMAVAVAIDASGNVWVGGKFEETGDFGGIEFTAAGLTDLWVAQLSGATGAHIRSKRYGGAGYDYLYSLRAEGTYFLGAGAFSNLVDFGITALNSNGSLDIFLVRLDP